MENECGELDLNGFQYNWVCAICLLNAKSGVVLEFQLRDSLFNTNIYLDIDDTAWLICCTCSHKFHAKCVSSLELPVLSAMGPFCCCRN